QGRRGYFEQAVIGNGVVKSGGKRYTVLPDTQVDTRLERTALFRPEVDTWCTKASGLVAEVSGKRYGTQVAECRGKVSGNAVAAAELSRRKERQRFLPPRRYRRDIGKPDLRVILHADGFAESAVPVATQAEVDKRLIADTNICLCVNA